MDKINLNLYGLNFQKPLTKKEDEKPKNETPALPNENSRPVEQGKMLNAMELAALQNKALVGGAASLPNPKDYLDDESIARIQNSVVEFEKAVEKYSKAVDTEFGNNLSDSQKQTLVLQAVQKNM